MSKWDKLIARICGLSKDLRFHELRKVLESYRYELNAPKSGSSHYPMRRKTPCFSYGDIRRVHRIYASN